MTDSIRNLVLLSVDALRADHCSCYGYRRETTPVLDSIASTGARFANAYSASSHTREAVPALLTGRYPDEATDDGYRLTTDTVAMEFQEAGFVTGGFHSNPFVSRAYGFDRGFDAFDDDLRLGNHRFVALAQRAFDIARNRHYARAETINERSLEWLDSIEEPFFLWNHYMDVHGPYEPPKGYRTFCTEYPGDRAAGRLYKRAIRDPESITDAERETLLDCYDDEIRYTDERIGTFLEELEARGLLDETVVVITADHGDAFGEHGYYEHPRYLHEELLHVPMIVRGPGIDTAVHDVPASTLDVVPTLLEYGGLDASGLPGRSLKEVAENGSDGRRVFGQAHGEGDDEGVRRFSARNAVGWSSLEYDLDAERVVDERRRSGGEPLLDTLREHVAERTTSVGRTAEASDADEPSEEIQRRLQALGYRE